LGSHTVQEFAKIAFDKVGLNWEDYVTTSDKYHRPNEVKYLLGDPTKVKSELNWKPNTTFEMLVQMMVDHDINLATRESVLIKENLMKPTWEYPK